MTKFLVLLMSTEVLLKYTNNTAIVRHDLTNILSDSFSSHTLVGGTCYRHFGKTLKDTEVSKFWYTDGR